MNNAKTLFTFITEKAGSTIVEQRYSSDLDTALREWHGASQAGLGPFPEDTYDPPNPTPIEETTGVWCYSGIAPDDVFFLTNIVATVGLPFRKDEASESVAE
ncbi:MAG: hypothetical protein SF066_16150 [Thermoanaerobaculia bacterium]|nr:hypothetical protein [Thermoanaerobaculia bacterium]